MQYLVSVIDDKSNPGSADRRLDVALRLASEASKVCDRKIEVRPFQ